MKGLTVKTLLSTGALGSALIGSGVNVLSGKSDWSLENESSEDSSVCGAVLRLLAEIEE